MNNIYKDKDFHTNTNKEDNSASLKLDERYHKEDATKYNNYIQDCKLSKSSIKENDNK